ncbi:NUDIX hydrolase [Vagococcus martis]|uniref:NUDIX hydrolase n=1 Tax=Vagococcus martis TaxID=1768210 RepID=A0A1V4DJT2_9ENTE|nr:NUDIX domain-containing protein [Vagococcus martis]OPF88785.1 NUDIX hydrolase [Vagococcus martis]
MKDYLLELRKEVGNRPLVVAGVLGLLIENNELLLIKRSDNGLWGLPAGSIELYESPYTAMCRELFEETGLKTKESDLELLNVFGGKTQTYTYPNGDVCSFVSISFYIKAYSQHIVKVTSETKDCRFFSLKELPSDIARHEMEIINDFCDHYLSSI